MKKEDKMIIDEKYFPYENMSLDERNYYLDIIRNCQDICDTIHKVNGKSKCNLVMMRLKKDNDLIYMNGAVQIDEENRCIDGYICIKDNNVCSKMSVVRLCTKDKIKEYEVTDEFYIENGKLMRRSRYDYDINPIYSDISNNEMKGRLR